MQRLSLHQLAVAAALAFAGPAAAHTLAPGEPITWAWTPWILLGLWWAAAAYGFGAARMSREQRRRILGWRRPAAFAAGIATVFIALISPLDALADKLFWVHMVQHMVLLLVAPALLVFSRPVVTGLWAFDVRWRRTIGRAWMHKGPYKVVRPLTRPVPAALLWSFVLWFWHMPAPYAWALENEAVHSLDHLSFLIAGLAVSNIVIQPYGRRVLGYGAALLYVAVLGFESTLLGAILTFASQPLYPAHIATAPAYGLTALQDQQVGGLIMWVVMGTAQLWPLCVLFMAWLGEAERRTASVRNVLPTSINRGLLVIPLLLVLLAGCTEDASPPSRSVIGGDPVRGAALIKAYGCTGCHWIPGIEGPHGAVGPPLIGIGERTFIAGVLPNTPANLTRWIRFPQRVDPDSAMPDLGVSVQDARDIAAYLYTLQ